MVARVAIVGLVILVVGLGVGIAGVLTPVSTASSVSLLNTSLHVDPNDYQSANTVIPKGETVTYKVSIDNTTLFQFYIMNQTQYYTYYGCAPWCHTAANVSGVGPIPPQNLTALVNVTGTTPSSPQSGSFSAPSNGTYYMIFDNALGPSWASYYAQNASGFTDGNFTLDLATTTHSANWSVTAAGIVVVLIGGALATAMWEARPAMKPPS